MQLRTFGAISATVLSVGAGAVTQVPEWSFLARPLAIVAGTIWLTVLAIFVYRNRKIIVEQAEKVTPVHLQIIGLVGVVVFAAAALAGVIWQSRYSPRAIASSAGFHGVLFPDDGGPIKWVKIGYLLEAMPSDHGMRIPKLIVVGTNESGEFLQPISGHFRS